MQAPGGVEQHDVIGLEPGRLDRPLGDLDRLLAGDDRQGFDIGLAAEHGELLLRGRAGDVERGHQHLLALFLGQALGELGGGRGLARALKADHHHHRRRIDVDLELRRVRAERFDQLVVNDLDDHLAGRDRAQHLLADGALRHLVDEVARDRQSDIGLEQRDAHFTHRRTDVALVQRAAAAKLVEDAGEPVAQIVKHSSLPTRWQRPYGEPQRKLRRRTKPRRPACTLGRCSSCLCRKRRAGP